MQQMNLIDEDNDLKRPDLMSEGITYEETERQLEQYLRHELARFVPFDFMPCTETDINAKWRFSSAMQKSIRRGYVQDAIKYALVYHRLDPTSFWRRIVIVAFEDIGVGGIWEVALTLMAASSKVWRKKVGGDEKIIQYIVKRMTESVKDRSVCDYYQALFNYPAPQEQLARLEKCTHGMLAEIMLHEHGPTPFKERYENLRLQALAAWLLWGSDRYENKMLPYKAGSRELFISTVKKMKLPGLVKYITIRGMTACHCGMNICYPFMWRMMEDSDYVRIVERHFPNERIYLNGVPEEAYDKHVLEGRNSLARFVHTCPEVKVILNCFGIDRRNARIASVGASLFICEGALLDKKLDFEGVNEICELTETSDYADAGLSLEIGRLLSSAILIDGDLLRSARLREVMGKMANPILSLQHHPNQSS